MTIGERINFFSKIYVIYEQPINMFEDQFLPIVPEIRMISLDTIVEDGNDNTLAGVASSPGRLDIHIEAPSSSPVQMPLLLEHWISGKQRPDLSLRWLLTRVGRGFLEETVPRVFKGFHAVAFVSPLFYLLLKPENQFDKYVNV